MKVLAIDTSSDACSVALQTDHGRYERHEVRPREHTRLLLPMIRDVLGEAGMAAADITLVALGNGPGSFIGMRIAGAVAQGICHGSGARLVPVSSLAAVAAEVFDDPSVTEVLVAQDAHMQEVYLGRFAVGPQGLPRELQPVRLQPVGPVADLNGTAIAAGAGWKRYPALWESNGAALAGRRDVDYPRAARLIPLARQALEERGSIDPERLEPFYVRDRVATPRAAGKSS